VLKQYFKGLADHLSTSLSSYFCHRSLLVRVRTNAIGDVVTLTLGEVRCKGLSALRLLPFVAPIAKGAMYVPAR
jgi:hypothetical protein